LEEEEDADGALEGVVEAVPVGAGGVDIPVSGVDELDRLPGRFEADLGRLPHGAGLESKIGRRVRGPRGSAVTIAGGEQQAGPMEQEANVERSWRASTIVQNELRVHAPHP
jgi:hypothetical protein